MNDYFGWYPGPGGQLVDEGATGAYFDQMHQFYPRMALFVTEYGAESNHDGPVDEKGTYEFQSSWMQFQNQVFDQHPFINGAIAWILRDFKVRPGWDGGNPTPQPPYNQMTYFHIYFSVAAIGFFYLLPTDLLFSLWFFFLLTKMEEIGAGALGG